MRDMSKFSRTVSGITKKAVAIAIVCAMSLPNAAYANDTTADYQEEFHADHMQEILDEAEALGVPNAFIRHYLASDLEEGKIAKPAKALKMKNAKNASGVTGLATGKVNLATLAKTRIDLGVFNFDEYKAANLVYNFASSKKVKGKVYFYDDAESKTPIAEGVVKRSSDDPWGKTKSLALDVRKLNLTGEKHLYVNFVADSVVNDNGTINEASTDEGKIYLESLFFTEGSTPVVSFDLDKDINSIDSVNASGYHLIMSSGTMNVSVPEGYKSPVSGQELSDKTYELDYVKGRGNSTWQQTKRPYKVKLKDSDELLGMPANKHWALLANYFDYTLLRNRYTYYLAKELGLNYTPDGVPVDVVMDGEYYGSYLLSETIRIDKNRIDIDNLEDEKNPTDPDKITGGYLLSHGAGWLGGEELPEVGGDYKPLYIEKPEYDSNTSEEVKQAEIDYLNDYINKIYEAVYNAGSKEEGVTDWRTLLDEDSLIMYTLIQAYTNNGDAYSGSTYYYKPRNGKLYCGPVWDFDFVAWAAQSTSYEKEFGYTDFYTAYEAPWFMDLYKNDDEFKDRVVEIWNKFSNILKDSIKTDGVLDKMAKETYMSALANYQVASSYLIDGKDYWGWTSDKFECFDSEGNPYTLNYFNEINRLKDFVTKRAEWVDENIDSLNGSYNPGYSDQVDFYVDDELYAQIDINECGVLESMPEEPKKDGYVFAGWYAKDAYGEEVSLASVRDFRTYVYDDELKTRVQVNRHYYAKFVKESDLKEIEKIRFVKDVICVPLYFDNEISEDENDGEYQKDALYLGTYLEVSPKDAAKKFVNWEVVDEKGNPVEKANITVSPEGKIEVFYPGTYYIKASIKNLSAILRINAVDEVEVDYPTSIKAKNNMELEVGEKENLDIVLGDDEKTPYYYYNWGKYIVSDESIAVVDDYGNVIAKKAGKTTVVSVFDFSEISDNGKFLVASTEITVKEKNEKPVVEEENKAPKVGTILKDKSYSYKITKAASDNKKKAGEVTLKGFVNKKVKKANIKSVIKIDGYKYKVTAISKKAFVNAKKLTKVTIGKNVKTIGVKAFYNLKNLNKVVIKSNKISKIGTKAFARKAGKKITFKVSKKKIKAYKKLLKKAKTNKYTVKK